MKALSKTEIFKAPPDRVFDVMDDLGVSGAHMTNSSMMMMGSKLSLEYLTPFHKGPGTKYRWKGKMMGLRMDFTMEVTKWIEGVEKVWETIGESMLIIYSGFQMTLKVYPESMGAKAELSISYNKPTSFIQKILCFLLADWYCNWCLRKMLNDARKVLQE
jgi:hypothetical protein